MKLKHSLAVLLTCICHRAFAQQAPILLRATSPKVAIQDGDEGKTEFWNHLEMSAQPIVYPLAKHQGPRKVVFYTDVDSMSFSVEPNATYPFQVILNGKDTCNALLSTVAYKPALSNPITTLPFHLKDDKEIMVTGAVNGSASREFMIDLGARYNYLIGKDIAKANKVVADGHIEDESVSGLTTEATSSGNKITLGEITLENVPICIIEDESVDMGLIGHRAFEGTILELDFDEEKLTLHGSLPGHAGSYTKIPLRQTTGGLYIQVALDNGATKASGWFFIDTGADNALSVDAKFAQQHQLAGSLKKLGEGTMSSPGAGVVKMDILEVPHVWVGSQEFKNVPTTFPSESHAEAEFECGVIGIGLLKRLNIILDFEHGAMYLKPNRRADAPFGESRKKGSLVVPVAIGAVACTSLLAFFFLRRRRKAR